MSLAQHGGSSSLAEEPRLGSWLGGSRIETRAEDGEKSSAALAALRELRAELRFLEKKITALQDSKGRHAHRASQVLQELDKPISALEREGRALRAASITRFEQQEAQLDLIESHHTATAERLSGIKRRKIADLEEEEARSAKRSRARSHRSTSERGEAAVEHRSSRRQSPSPTHARALFDSLNVLDQSRSANGREASPIQPAAHHPPAKPEPGELTRRGRIVPDWAASIKLQAQPLPGGQDFSSIVHAFHAAYAKENIEPGQPIDMASQLRRIDPAIFKRHGVERWKNLIPLAQAHLAMYLVLPSLQRELKRCGGERVILDLARPYYSAIAKPPDYVHQVAALCIQAGIKPHAWFQRSHAVPPCRRSARSARTTRPHYHHFRSLTFRLLRRRYRQFGT